MTNPKADTSELASREDLAPNPYHGAYMYDLFYRYPCHEIVIEEDLGEGK